MNESEEIAEAWAAPRVAQPRPVVDNPFSAAARRCSPETALTRIQWLEGQNEVLELLARGAPLTVCVTRLAHVIEVTAKPALCAIFLPDASGTRLCLHAAPGLPAAYHRAFENLDIVSGVEPCGTAAHREEPVVVEDISGDPLWSPFANLVGGLGLRACWAQPIPDQDGKVLAVVALNYLEPHEPSADEYRTIDSICSIARIVIEHTRRAHALESANERFASLAASVPGVVYQRLVSPDGTIRYTYISDGARDLFGVSATEILTNPQALFDCHGPEYRQTFRENLLAASRELRMWDVEAEIITRGGQRKWSHAIARPQRQPDGSVLWNGIILDATRIKEANLALAASNRAKSEFLANMSHELRTPLNAIIGFSDVIRGEILGEIGNARYKGYADDIYASGMHLLEIINDILDLAKIETGKLELIEDAFDLGPAIENSVRLVHDRAKANDIALTIDLPPNLPRVHADGRKIKQILINLLSNAVKFTPKGGKMAVTACVDASGGIAMSVADTGIGIAPEHMTKVLEPFAQVDSSLNRKFEGTGLGLSLTKAMIELHGGSLLLESQVGVGTTVTVRLPRERVLD